MALTVVLVAYPLAPVGPDAVGGAEQVLTQLDEALVGAGHRSIVVACEGSRCTGELVAIPAPRGPLDDAAREAAEAATRDALARVCARERPDVVHLHGIDFDRTLPPPGPPTLVTLHLPLSWYAPDALRPSRPGTWLHAVSASQRRAGPPGLTLLDDVGNGVDLSRFAPAAVRDGPALCLGRLCPEKGYDLALQAAQRADLPLDLAGAVFAYPSHRAWFEAEIRPRLDGARRWLGPVGGDAKRTLLARARCVVVPSLVAETSSLVAMEALASGTPVVAFRSGALSDLVEDGRTGRLVDPGDVDGLAAALHDVDALDGALCRRTAEARFSVEQTVATYLDRYEQLARAASPSRSPGVVVRTLDREALIDTAPAWRALWSTVPGARAFQHPAWQLAWIEHFGGDGSIVALTADEGGELAACLPLWVRDESGTRVARLVGVGVSDTLDLLARPGADRTIDAIVRALKDVADVVHLDDLPDPSPLAAVDLGGRSASVACPVVDLPGWRARASSRLLANVAQARRRLEREHDVRVDVATPVTLDAHLTTLLTLHGARWAARGEAGVLTDEGVVAFHRQAARGLIAEGLLDNLVLRVDGRAVAACHLLRDRDGVSYYLGGFDPTLARYGPGALLLSEALARSELSGGSTFDFLRGAEPYKYAWGAVDRPQWRRTWDRARQQFS